MADAQPSMSVRADGDVRAAEDQVRRIVASPVFASSPVLQSFLSFVAGCAFNGREAEINEYRIATEVFARKSAFDPATDTIVRTQAYRLRAKLQQYYRTVWIDDPVLIEIPKGHYLPVFSSRNPGPGNPGPALETESASVPRESPRWRRIGLMGTALVGALLLGWFAGSRSKPAPARRATPLEAFWLSLLETDKQPIVAFSNRQFLGTETGDLLRFTGGPVADRGALMNNPAGVPKQGGRLYFEDDYTGVGEVVAAAAISHILSPLAGPISFKRSRLVTSYDLQNHNLVFLGSTAVNPILNELTQTLGFIYRSAQKPPLLWHAKFENVHPASGEAAFYELERDPATGVIRAEYATVTLMPGVAPGRKILVLSGLTTAGTQGAAESVTTLQGATELAVKLGVDNPSDPKRWPDAFQVLLRVELSRGLDVIQVRTVASRVATPGK